MSTGYSDAAMSQERQRVAGSAGKRAGAAQLKVAIVCDWLLGTGGAERVVLELHKQFPEAPIYTSQYDPKDSAWFGSNWFADADIRTTWLQRLPKALRKFFPFLRAWAFSRLDLSQYDLVISSSGAEAKFVKVKPGATHVCYCLAPTHYYWGRYEEYLANPGFGWLDPLARLGLRLLAGPMRRWDHKAAQRPDYFIGISSHIKQQIKKYYGRDSVVIHPPVDIERFKKAAQSQDRSHGFVAAGRQTPYKRIDLAVKACSELNEPLLVIGRGPEHKKLVKSAGRNVTFLTNVSDTEIPERFGGSKGFIFPGIDDFGIVAVEAMAAGTPVIAYGAGGALDYVNSKSGITFEKQTVESLIKALQQFKQKSFEPAEVSKQADQFSAANFRQNISEYIKKL